MESFKYTICGDNRETEKVCNNCGFQARYRWYEYKIGYSTVKTYCIHCYSDIFDKDYYTS